MSRIRVTRASDVAALNKIFSEEVASRNYHLEISEVEMVKLLRGLAEGGHVLSCGFGIGWTALDWEKGTPMPESVRQLGLLRGILNENMSGAGI